MYEVCETKFYDLHANKIWKFTSLRNFRKTGLVSNQRWYNFLSWFVTEKEWSTSFIWRMEEAKILSSATAGMTKNRRLWIGRAIPNETVGETLFIIHFFAKIQHHNRIRCGLFQKNNISSIHCQIENRFKTINV